MGTPGNSFNAADIVVSWMGRMAFDKAAGLATSSGAVFCILRRSWLYVCDRLLADSYALQI